MLNNGVKRWSMSSAKYVQEAVHNVEDYIEKNLDGRKLKRNPTHSLTSNYTTEDDERPELPPSWHPITNVSSGYYIGL